MRLRKLMVKSLFDGKAETVNDTKVRRNPSNPISADPWENWHMDKTSYDKHFKNKDYLSHLKNPDHEYVVQQARQDRLPVPQHYQGTGESLSNHQPTASQVKQSKQEAQQKEAYFKTPKGHAEEMAAMHERHRVIKDRARFGKSTSVRPLVVKSLFDGKPETHESLQHDVVPKTPAPPVKFTPPANYDKSRDYEYKNELGKMQTRRAQNKDIIHTYLLHPPATRQEQLHSNKAVREYNELTARIHAHPFNNRHETANAESRKRDTDDHWNEITAETEWLNKHQAHDKEKPQDIINRKNHMANYRFHSNASTGHGYYEPRPKEST